MLSNVCFKFAFLKNINERMITSGNQQPHGVLLWHSINEKNKVIQNLKIWKELMSKIALIVTESAL